MTARWVAGGAGRIVSLLWREYRDREDDEEDDGGFSYVLIDLHLRVPVGLDVRAAWDEYRTAEGNDAGASFAEWMVRYKGCTRQAVEAIDFDMDLPHGQARLVPPRPCATWDDVYGFYCDTYAPSLRHVESLLRLRFEQAHRPLPREIAQDELALLHGWAHIEINPHLKARERTVR